MKYEIPEINISKFSIENIVTASAATVAKEAMLAADDTLSTDTIVSTDINDWVAVTN